MAWAMVAAAAKAKEAFMMNCKCKGLDWEIRESRKASEQMESNVERKEVADVVVGYNS
jgi:hypothetical protein